MNWITNFITTVQQNPELVEYYQNNVTMVILGLLLIGFLVLLMEIRLPLKYYWDLPLFALESLLRRLRGEKVPVWGYCLDIETNSIIAVAAVELLDAESKKLVQRGYSNHLGQYGFLVGEGRYLVRAVKNYYQMPSILTPENIQLIKVEESFVLPIDVDHQKPQLNLKLVPLEKYDPSSPKGQLVYSARALALSAANFGLLAAIFLSFVELWVLEDLRYAILLLVGVVFLVLKLYIVDTVSKAAMPTES